MAEHGSVRVHHAGTLIAEAAVLAPGTAVLLGRMTASVAALPRPGDQSAFFILILGTGPHR